MRANGSETMFRVETPDGSKGRMFTISGVGLVQLLVDADGSETIITQEPLGPQQQERLEMWLAERKQEPIL